MSPPALAARGVEVVYPGGARALAGVDLEVAAGRQRVAIARALAARSCCGSGCRWRLRLSWPACARRR